MRKRYQCTGCNQHCECILPEFEEPLYSICYGEQVKWNFVTYI